MQVKLMSSQKCWSRNAKNCMLFSEELSMKYWFELGCLAGCHILLWLTCNGCLPFMTFLIMGSFTKSQCIHG